MTPWDRAADALTDELERRVEARLAVDLAQRLHAEQLEDVERAERMLLAAIRRAERTRRRLRKAARLVRQTTWLHARLSDRSLLEVARAALVEEGFYGW